MLLNDLTLSVMEEFIRGYTSDFTGSQIAKKRGLNQKSVSNYLRRLEKEGFLISKIIGKNRHFLLNLEDPETIINFISAIEHFKTISFFKKNLLVKEVMGKIKSSCHGTMVIFGSYAKGTQKKDSDLDMFITGSYNQKKMSEVSEMYGLDISIKNYTDNIFTKALTKKDPLLAEIIKDHIIVSNVEDFVSKVIRLYYERY